MTDTASHVEAPDQPMLRIPKSAHPTPTAAVRSSRRMPALAFAGIVLAMIAVVVVGTQAQVWFGTTGQMTSSSGERVVPAVGADTSQIKGWMSLQQVLDAYPVTQASLYAHFAIPAETATETTLSELKESGASSIDVPALRAWIDDGAPASS